MGQAWCKEKTSKAQDSKSPLDRVFVRCAHRIYPGLKEEGSVLGGATQRVTSSEIGYAGSPPREVLTRGRSIDSVDRPFHPSDWVDVNLEVPSTPRASSVLTNLTVDTGLYPAATPTSSCSNLKDATPIPPPRRRKRNRGRPLPPKPDEIPENITSNLRHVVDTGDEPLYSSVKSPKTSGDEQDAEGETRGTGKSRSSAEDTKQTSEGKKKEIYEHKINGTGRIISSDIVSGKKPSCERRSSKTPDLSHHRRAHESEEYEKFARNQSIKDTSTPNRQDRRRSRDLEKTIENPPRDGRSEVNARTKNYSTVSLPNYDELDVERHLMKRTKDEDGLEKTKSKRPVRSSTGSLPAEAFLSPFSEKTSVRLEDYISRRGSIEHLSPYQVLERLDCSENGVSEGGFVKYDPSKLEDWDLSDISNCELNHRQHSCESSLVSEIGSGNLPGKRSCARSEDVVDYSQDAETGEKEVIEKVSSFDGRDVPHGSASLQKPEAFGKTPSPVLERDSKNLDAWLVTSNRSLRYFGPPTMADVCKNSTTTCEPRSTSVRREPFFLNEQKQRSAVDTIGGSCRHGAVQESDRSDQSRMIFGRSLSNESEPCDDSYEPKELRAHSAVTASDVIRTISEESLPREMPPEGAREDFFGEKLAKDAHNKMKKDCAESRTKTPPPSPEPKIKAEILDNDHSSLLKILKEEAEGSNLSSMTPSLTELEAALSDMLEKEEERDEDEENGYERIPVCKPSEKPIEPKIIPVEKKSSNAFEEGPGSVEILKSETGKTNGIGGNDGKSLVELSDNVESTAAARGRKVSFCAWEETRMAGIELTDENCADRKAGTCLLDEAPEKPGRLLKGYDESTVRHVESVPTPPRRKHKGSLGVLREDDRTAPNGATDELYRNDRLI